MRFHTLLLPLAVLLASPAPASAQSDAAGNYASKFEVVADNCKGVGMKLESGTVTISQRGTKLTVDIDDLPQLQGTASRKGKLRAKAEGASKTPGVSAKYAFNGRTEDERLQAVFVAEYFRGGKPVCTQSFSVDGTRKKL